MSEPYIAWVLAGFVLVIAELVTGTFYLLVLGLAAFAGGAAAWYGPPFFVQAIVAAAVGLAGVFWVRGRRRMQQGADMPSLDVGQPVGFEAWVNPVARHARVRYRDTQWDAFVEDDGSAAAAVAGDVFYIAAMQGNTLTVTRARPRVLPT